MVKNPPTNAEEARDPGSIPISGGSPEVGNGTPLQCSCLENSMGRGACRATVHWVAKQLDMTELLNNNNLWKTHKKMIQINVFTK